MDLQGIGAIASAVIAGVGIPAAVVVGKWNTTAAVRNAEATAAAGREQAEAAYRAALDAARSQAQAQRDQWRYARRSDAWVAFLHAVDDFVRVTTTLYKVSSDRRKDVLAEAVAVTGKAYAAVQIEGPSFLITYADDVHRRCAFLEDAALDWANFQYAAEVFGNLSTGAEHDEARNEVTERVMASSVAVELGSWGTQPESARRHLRPRLEYEMRCCGVLDDQQMTELLDILDWMRVWGADGRETHTRHAIALDRERDQLIGAVREYFDDGRTAEARG
ncbi:hypothetical protein [Streptomyces chattanoogensis]|uniref:hypothetical protein n=1 Tax=Streptomyces chattanoogensis TaxID=66876 RepID=UPI00368E2F92